MATNLENLGRRINVGDVIKTADGSVVVTYLCQYRVSRYGMPAECPYQVIQEEWYNDTIIRGPRCPDDICRSNGGGPICYKTQDLKYYLEEHNMKTQEIKKAIKLPNGHAVAEGDIVIVEKAYVDRSNEYADLFVNNKAIGRVETIGPENIEVDFSKEYNSRVYTFAYNDLKSIALANCIHTVTIQC